MHKGYTHKWGLVEAVESIIPAPFYGIPVIGKKEEGIMRKWKIALVGCGDIAEHIYMPQMPLNKKAEVVAFCDLKPERLKVFQEKFGERQIFGHVDKLLEECDFDILMDTASIPAHYELNMKALRAGKHLYSQKPAGLTVEQVTDMIEMAERMHVKFAASPVHMLRDDIREAKALVQSGAVGRVMFVRGVAAHGGPEYFQYRVNDPTWFYRPGAGALYDLGVHCLTMVTGILGPAREVSCMAGTLEPERRIRSGNFDGKIIDSNQLRDMYSINLKFDDRTMANVTTGFCMKATKSSSLEIYGELGTIHFGDSGLEVYADSPERRFRGWMKTQPQVRPEREFYHCSCIADLIDAIEEDRQPVLRPEHARHVVELMGLIEKAAADGKVYGTKTVF